MTRIATALGVLTACAIALPAHATGTLTRTFVSSAGVDTNPCTVTAPCATFAAAYAAVAANGIVAALDPGKYGPLTITTGVTINGNGWSAITGLAAGNGITVTAGSGEVTLTGLEIDGAGTAYNGIDVTSAGHLTVTNCTLQNFFFPGAATTGNGILIEPTSGTLNFAITDTTASNNGNTGIFVHLTGSANVNGNIDHVVAAANSFGISIDASAASGGTTVVAVANSIASNNTNTGVDVAGGTGPTVKVSLDNVNASSNSDGLVATGAASVLLGRSVIIGNNIDGLINETSPNALYTYLDNRINLNFGADLSGTLPLNMTFTKQ